jgi:hypothetical protein
VWFLVLLARAGIQTQWIHCLGHMQVPRPALCGANLESGTVMTLETHLGHPSNLGDPPGAAAVEDATRQSTPLRFANARSIIDFLLLGEMRAVWGKSEIPRDGAALASFQRGRATGSDAGSSHIGDSSGGGEVKVFQVHDLTWQRRATGR